MRGCRTPRPDLPAIVHTWTVLAGAVLIALIGAIDDAIDLNPLLKLLGQIAAAIVAVRGGAVIEDLTIPFARLAAVPSRAAGR